jgi:hypothetical protein
MRRTWRRVADRTKHPISRSLERRGEAVDDPEEADEHGKGEQNAEDIENLLEGPDLARYEACRLRRGWSP